MFKKKSREQKVKEFLAKVYKDEWFILITEDGTPLGRLPRKEEFTALNESLKVINGLIEKQAK